MSLICATKKPCDFRAVFLVRDSRILYKLSSLPQIGFSALIRSGSLRACLSIFLVAVSMKFDAVRSSFNFRNCPTAKYMLLP
jgi:hypothetical protein